MKEIKLYFTATFLFIVAFGFSQNVGINADGSLPEGSAMLDIKSTSKGLLIPRMTSAQKTAISSPVAGLMVYQTDATAGFYYWNGSAWTQIGSGGGSGTVTSVATGIGLTGGPITSTGTISLATSGVTAGSYTRASITVDTYGRITVAGNGAAIDLTADITGVLPVINGGTGSATASGARTNLGATTLGSNLFTITNPSAITFPRFNADNTVSALTAANFRTAIGAGTGSISSISGSGGTTGLTLNGGPITTSGTLTLGGVLAVTNGGTGTPTGCITGTSELTFNAGGTNQDILLRPSGTGYTVIRSSVGIGAYPFYPSNQKIKLHIKSNDNYYAMKIENTYSTLGSYGLYIQTGSAIGDRMIGFVSASGLQTLGYIAMNTATTVSYSTSSDRRLKNNIVNTHFGITDLMKIQVRDYVYKADSCNTLVTGFVAQELYDIFPNAVTKPIKEEETWGVDYGKVTPLLVKAVQDQQAIIEAQQKQIEELKKIVDGLLKK